MFSVIIPLYNKEKYIAHTLQSVLDQTFHDFEIIIVNDGSTDESVKEVEKFHDERIRLVEQTNAGVSAARNRGIEEAKYDLIAFLDADDLWEIDFLQTAFELHEHYPRCDIFALNYKIMTAEETFHSPIINGIPTSFHHGIIQDYFKIASQSDPLICSISVVIKKESLRGIGGFPVGIRAGEDLLTWAKLAVQFDIAYTKEQKAIFNRIGQKVNTPPRKPDMHNRVGEELRTLLGTGKADKIHELKSYIAFWHKIRLANFLRLGEQVSARGEFRLMSEFAKKDLKYFIYAFLVYSPTSILKPLTQSVLHVNRLRRKVLSKYGK